MKSIQNFILLNFIIFSTIYCQNPNNSVDKYSSIDTLLSDDCNYTFSLNINRDIFTLKKENTIYQLISNNQLKRGKLTSDYYIDNFNIIDNYLAYSEILEDLPPKTFIYSIKEAKNIKTIENYIFYSFTDNFNFLYFKQESDSIYFYINNLKSSNFEYIFKGLNVKGFYCEGLLYFYEMFDPDRTKYTNLTIIDIKSKEHKSLEIPCYNKYLYFSSDTLLAISDNKLYLSTFDNENIASWDIPDIYSKILISDKKVEFYFWDNNDDELCGSTEYHLLRQTLDIGNYLNKNQHFKSIVLDKD